MEVENGRLYTDTLSIRISDLDLLHGVDRYAARNASLQDNPTFKVNKVLIHAYNFAVISSIGIALGAGAAAVKEGLERIF